jgi:hypothetical protein
MAECSNLKNFSPNELSYLATSIATAMAKNIDDDSAAVLSSFFFGIGSTLGLISRQRTLIKDCCNKQKNPSVKTT